MTGTATPDSDTRRDNDQRANGRRKGLALALLCLTQFMVILDTSIVNVALPAIRADLGFASQARLQYVISLYALTFGGSLILAGRLADLFGRRRVFIIGLVAFAAASLGCGLAQAPVALLAGRAVQGVASALMSAAALSLLTTLFAEGAERNRALGAWGAVGGAAGASGLVLGGLLTTVAGWPWIFFVNIPIAAAAAAVAPRLLPVGGAVRSGKRRLDLPGALTVTMGLGLLIFGLTRGEHAGFTSGTTLGLLAGAVALLAGFVAAEQRTSHPLVDFRLFRLPGVAGANLGGLLLTTIIASNIFFATLYTQQILGFSPLLTGLAFVPHSALVLVGSAAASRLTGRIGTGPVLAIGFAILATGSLLLTGLSADGSYLADVLPGFALVGLGLGFAFVAVTIGATQGVRDEDQGLASGVVNTAVQIGFAVGIAAVVAVATAKAEAASGSPAAQMVAGYSTGYLVDTGIAVLGIVLALVLVPARSGRGAT